MKRIILIVFGIILLAGLYLTWRFFGPATHFKSQTKFLYIPTGNATKENVLQLLEKDSMIRGTGSFDWVADRMHYWNQIKPGKYKIASGSSVFHIVRVLRNGQQTPVNLVITKLRTKEDLASLTGRKFECDSMSMIGFLNDEAVLSSYQLDTNTVMTAVFPNTYTYFWNTTPEKIFGKIIKNYRQFWTPEKISLAKEQGLTRQTAYILASIIEEETNKNDEKGNIASVYLNRMRTGMKLGADPTVKFALRDFSLKRIYNKHLAVESPYNTYRVAGLPPGPICTPSASTINAVLHAPKTEYYYFVARSDFSGYHSFAATYDEHLKFARQYQEALNAYMLRKQPAKDNLDK